MEFITLLFAVALTIIHLFSFKIKFLHSTPRSIWLSFAGGSSVSYIFVYLLPELAEGQKVLESSEIFYEFLSHHIYLISLLGLSLFYGLERYISLIKEENRDNKVSGIDFWTHISAFAFYNFLIGYLLLHRQVNSIMSSTFFFLAMGFHFLINDYGLNQHHKDLYIKKGRWILSFAILLGWGTGFLTSFSEIILLSVTAFLSGGIILNVLKEELPEERKSNFWAFLAGVVFFSLILLLV